MNYNPGSDAALRYPDWVIRHVPLRGVPEVLCRRRKVILIERAMPVGDRRTALAHAIAHLDLGHDQIGSPIFETREELAADDLAAERLLPFDVYAYWAPRVRSIAELAEEVQVSEWLVQNGWDLLSAAQRRSIRESVEDRDQGAA